MDKIPHSGSKWNSMLKKPISEKSRVPYYVFLGSLQEGNTKITINQLRDCDVIQMPNDAMSYCIPGIKAEERIVSLVSGFFVLLSNGFIPRDIEFVVDGRTRTQSHTVILDFNEVKTIEERSELYGSTGYDPLLDTAHVYIDLCGLRSGITSNPMAPYDAPTSQWKFLCNPLCTPTTFLRIFSSYEDIGKLILDYTFEKHMRSSLDKTAKSVGKWKPLYIYCVDNVPDNCYVIGRYTQSQYKTYRMGQCVFYTPNPTIDDDTIYRMYIGSTVYRRDLEMANSHPYIEFDIRFQYYILGALCHALSIKGITINTYEKTYESILVDALKQFHIPVVEEDGFPSLFDPDN
jgi:hypothetical protein